MAANVAILREVGLQGSRLPNDAAELLADFLAHHLFASAAEAGEMIGRHSVELQDDGVGNRLKTVGLLPLHDKLIEWRDLPHSLDRGLPRRREELSLKHPGRRKLYSQLSHHTRHLMSDLNLPNSRQDACQGRRWRRSVGLGKGWWMRRLWPLRLRLLVARFRRGFPFERCLFSQGRFELIYRFLE